ncbi:MAG: nitrilase-related carbon-nitrogen hydrolase, partial [Bdellovibrionota bacterium]
AVIGPAGFVTKYRKRNLYITDTYYASPGDLGPITFKTPHGEFGLLICLDANYAHSFLEYKKMGIEQVIVPMNWDQDPNGGGNSRPARIYFQKMAQKVQLDIFVSDVSPWDGTGAYYPDREVRERNGLSDIAIGIDGVSYHELK